MSKQVEDIIEDISKKSDEELLERIREIRRTRNVKPKVSTKSKDRPATKAKAKDNALADLLAMSSADRAKLLASLT